MGGLSYKSFELFSSLTRPEIVDMNSSELYLVTVMVIVVHYIGR